MSEQLEHKLLSIISGYKISEDDAAWLLGVLGRTDPAPAQQGRGGNGVEAAFREGFRHGIDFGMDLGPGASSCWHNSQARLAADQGPTEPRHE